MQARRITLCRADEVELDGMKKVKAAGLDALCVYRTERGIFVTEDTCTHGLASLSEGLLENGKVFCPYHGGAFDIETGAATAFPCTDPIRTYRATIENGAVVIETDE